MNAKSTAVSLTAATFPAAIIIGAGLVTSTINGLQAQRDHYRALALQPRPTPTVTQVVASPPPPPQATVTIVAQRRPGASQPGPQTLGQPGTSGTSGTSGGSGGVMAAGEPQRPATSPSQQPTTQSCTGRLAAVQLRVLPNCAVTLGGSR